MKNVSLYICFLSMITTSTATFRVRKRPRRINTITFQESVPNYPEEIAKGLLSQFERSTKTLSSGLNNTQIIEMSRNQTQEQNITYTNLCNSTKGLRMYPQGVQIDNVDYYMLNPISNLFQYIETEVCTSQVEGNPCLKVQFGHSTCCIQEYMPRNVFVMPKAEPTRLVTMRILLPSCCSCFFGTY